MNKAEFHAKVASAAGVDAKQVGQVLDALADVTTSILKEGGEVTMPGLGKFKAETRPARTGRNPATGQEIQIPEAVKASFKPAKGLKDALQKAG